jgi:hypothetical protein
VRATCPNPARVSDPSPAGIASADAELALEYRRCQAKHGAAVSAYDALAAAFDELARAITARPGKRRR